MKKQHLILLLILASVCCTGCFRPQYNFHPGDYRPVPSNTLPVTVEKAFEKTYPTATIQSVDANAVPPTVEQCFRITFNLNGVLMETIYQETGREIEDSLREVRQADES